MLTEEKIYREGFLDGMRNSGKLVVDVPDHELHLSHDWKVAIIDAFKARNYTQKKAEGIKIMHEMITNFVSENSELTARVHELEQLLQTCNRAREEDLSKA